VARPKAIVPRYRLHKSSGQAYIYVDAKQVMLGKHGSTESRAKYARIIAERAAGIAPLPVPLPGQTPQPTIRTLIEAFWDHATVYYSKIALDESGEPVAGADGQPIREPKHELEEYRQILIPLRYFYARMTTAEFSCAQLETLREALARPGQWQRADGTLVTHRPWSRKVINRMVGRLRHVFGWGVTRRLVPASVYQELRLLPGLRKGQTVAPERAKVKPVDAAKAKAIIPHVCRQVGTMLQLQLLTGMRSSEVCIMRPIDIDRTEKPWSYTPRHHKTEHHDIERVIRLGPQSRKLIRPFLENREPTAFLFSPQEADIERRAELAKARKTKVQPSQIKRAQAAARRDRNSKLGARYDRNTYYRCVRYGCEAAFKMPEDIRAKPDDTPAIKAAKSARRTEWYKANAFHPHQARHRHGTDMRKAGGLEVAQVQLGHTSRAMAEHYSEADVAKTTKIVERMG